MSNTCPTRTRSKYAILSCEIATFAKRTLHGAGVMLAGGAPCQAAEKGKSECLVLHATLICVVRPRARGHCTCRLKSSICMEYTVLVCREFTGRKVVERYTVHVRCDPRARQSFCIRQERKQQRRQAQRQRLQWGEGVIWSCCFCGRGCGGDGSSSSWQHHHQQQHQERRQQQQEQQRHPQQRVEQGGRQSCDGGLRGHGDLRGLNSREQTRKKKAGNREGVVTAACNGPFSVSSVIGLNFEGKGDEMRNERKLMEQQGGGRQTRGVTFFLSRGGRAARCSRGRGSDICTV